MNIINIKTPLANKNSIEELYKDKIEEYIKAESNKDKIEKLVKQTNEETDSMINTPIENDNNSFLYEDLYDFYYYLNIIYNILFNKDSSKKLKKVYLIIIII
jgi:hypothetical protein